MARRRMTKRQAEEILAILMDRYPEAGCELIYTNSLELTVAVVLSAQCTDARVNMITEKLFEKYRCPADYLAVSQEELEADIHSAGFFRQKAKSIRGIMAAVLAKHGGEVPRTMAELTALPGVGRKTANVIMGNAFKQAEGIAVDTHVGRVARRLGLTRHDNPDKVEQDLVKLFPRDRWTDINHILIFHGRYTCAARKPRCADCPLAERCPSAPE
ncbi:MAG: endonuclease III [Lentisphaeria bacterium]|nr:endonuclease III [Lentisphaeria bacterium]